MAAACMGGGQSIPGSDTGQSFQCLLMVIRHLQREGGGQSKPEGTTQSNHFGCLLKIINTKPKAKERVPV